jgi:hypothetical protein
VSCTRPPALRAGEDNLHCELHKTTCHWLIRDRKYSTQQMKIFSCIHRDCFHENTLPRGASSLIYAFILCRSKIINDETLCPATDFQISAANRIPHSVVVIVLVSSLCSKNFVLIVVIPVSSIHLKILRNGHVFHL